jgi:hypothetical protein
MAYEPGRCLAAGVAKIDTAHQGDDVAALAAATAIPNGLTHIDAKTIAATA